MVQEAVHHAAIAHHLQRKPGKQPFAQVADSSFLV